MGGGMNSARIGGNCKVSYFKYLAFVVDDSDTDGAEYCIKVMNLRKI